MSKSIKETLEVVVALAVLTARAAQNLRDDGKISTTEALGFLAEFGPVRAALVGISEVPAELKDLTREEASELRAAIVNALTAARITHRTQEITDKLLELAYATVQTVLFIKNAPPLGVPL